ncbi:MAG TPA: hypothetical protein VHW60_05180 [Caulobacteraceae bacterium]|jgi:hypothetical protein|nr:hypothetical protein [Caulobacteraceae bacterium]
MQRHAIATALGLTALAAALPAHAEASDAQALRLMHECKAATGGAALDQPEAFRETGTITQDGQSSTYVTYVDLHALRSETERMVGSRPLRGGFDRTSSWRVSAAGQVQRQTGAAAVRGDLLGAWLTVSGYLYLERFPTTYRYLGRRSAAAGLYDLVEASPANADSIQLWLDARTHRLAHVDAISEGEHLTGDLGDYREIAGTWVAYSLDITQADQKISLRLASLTYIPLADAPIAPP